MKCAWCGCEIKYPYVVLYPTKYELVDSPRTRKSHFAASYHLKKVFICGDCWMDLNSGKYLKEKLNAAIENPPAANRIVQEGDNV